MIHGNRHCQPLDDSPQLWQSPRHACNTGESSSCSAGPTKTRHSTPSPNFRASYMDVQLCAVRGGGQDDSHFSDNTPPSPPITQRDEKGHIIWMLPTSSPLPGNLPSETATDSEQQETPTERMGVLLQN